ncbi:hypothetical protein BST97_00845 [Nonlabens spongiae]|uniref:IrrE N-terminal-like domain-containing protein n=1 Tax=Nonlabens spongiae TaxID=331648 RepID=A0A1W6MGD3_9FLAO|nr:ImmA/IrrE family metallo-endopeptidase [Nonlabens spongiae]ARN76664.1 hypothetical protein BST97_00845 [Nonlabens spongiae]
MNTVEKGDSLEHSTLKIIRNVLGKSLLGINEEFARVFTKKKYPSINRPDGEIEFDLTIEIWPPGANRCSLIYFIECKNYKSRIPISAVKKFYADICESTRLNAKAIFVSNSPLSKGAMDYASSMNMMVIEGSSELNYKIILYKRNFGNSTIIPWLIDDKNLVLGDDIDMLTQKIDSAIFECLIQSSEKASYGIDRLSKADIEKIAEKELNKFSEDILLKSYGISTTELVEYMSQEYGIKTQFWKFRDDSILGTCDIEERLIKINQNLQNTKRELFVIGHEFGHFILHQKLSINQNLLNSFSDSKFNFQIAKYELKNAKNWIEWQANYFSASLLIPKSSLVIKSWRYEGYKRDLRFNDDPKSIKHFNFVINRLSHHFNVSKTSIIYRLNEINMIKNHSRLKHIGDILGEWLSEYFIDIK